MTQPKVKVGTSWLTLDDIVAGQLPAGLNEQESHAIDFCRRWLKGDQSFEFHTSGSTGIPKNIFFNRDQLEASARLTAQALGLQPGYTSLVCLDTKFIAGAMMLVRGLVIEMNMIVVSPSANPMETVAEPIDFAAFVPYQLSSMLVDPTSKLSKIKVAIIGGAPLTNELIQQLQGYSSGFYATYGMTETLSHIALQKLNVPDQQSFFQVLPGVQIKQDDRGCLVIHASHLGNEPIVTNDVVSILSRNQFKWIGRFDQIINSGGVKINPEKVEQAVDAVFKAMNIQRRFFVTGIVEKSLGKQVGLIVEGFPLSEEQVVITKNKLAQQLDKYEVPRVIWSINQFLETPTQKIDRLGTVKLLQLPTSG